MGKSKNIQTKFTGVAPQIIKERIDNLKAAKKTIDPRIDIFFLGIHPNIADRSYYQSFFYDTLRDDVISDYGVLEYAIKIIDEELKYLKEALQVHNKIKKDNLKYLLTKKVFTALHSKIYPQPIWNVPQIQEK